MRSRSALTGIKIKQNHPIEVKKIQSKVPFLDSQSVKEKETEFPQLHPPKPAILKDLSEIDRP
jgi:hypothetical protein